MTDPIADMLIRIKNSLLARHSEVKMPYSKLKQAMATILVQEGYLEATNVAIENNFQQLVLTLKYKGKMPAVNDVKRLSKPGRRLYTPAKNIPRALGGYGITILSTNKGLMTDKEARKQNIGGELICQIW